MFFRSPLSTQPLTLYKTNCLDASHAREMLLLPDNSLFMLGYSFHDTLMNGGELNVALLDPVKHSKSVKNTLPYAAGHVHAVELPDNKIFVSSLNSDTQYILDSKTLTIIEVFSKQINQANACVPLDKDSIATVGKIPGNRKEEKDNYVLMVHNLKTKQFNQPASEPLYNCSSVNGLTWVTKNILAVSAVFSDEFSEKLDVAQTGIVLLGRKTDTENKFSYIKSIKNPSHSYKACAIGDVTHLHNGNILTYDVSGNFFEWNLKDTGTWREPKTVNTWDSKFFESKLRKSNLGWVSKVSPLPDGNHLLFNSGKKLFLFNMKTEVLKNIEGVQAFDFCVYPNGQICLIDRNDNIIFIDLPEMIAYRNSVIHELNNKLLRKLLPDSQNIITDYIAGDLTWYVHGSVPSADVVARAWATNCYDSINCCLPMQASSPENLYSAWSLNCESIGRNACAIPACLTNCQICNWCDANYSPSQTRNYACLAIPQTVYGCLQIPFQLCATTACGVGFVAGSARDRYHSVMNTLTSSTDRLAGPASQSMEQYERVTAKLSASGLFKLENANHISSSMHSLDCKYQSR